MANFNPIETSNLPDFSFDDYIDLPNYGAVFEEQTVAQSNFELDNSNTFGQYTPGVIDEQYRLPEIPPSNPFLGSPMEVVQFSGFANDILAPSQQSQSFYLNNVLQPSLSQQQYQTPYQVEHGLSGQYGVDGLATGYTSFSFNHMPSSDDTRISNAAEFSPYQQAFQPSGNSSSPSIPQEIHAQQSSSLGRLGSASLSCSVRPSEQGLVLTGASQPMGGRVAIPCTGRSAMSLRLMCDWKPCQGTHFKTREALSEHQEAHSRTLITTAKNEGLFECSWQDCDRKEVKKFKSLAALKKHLKQHVRGQWCLHGNCNAAFSRKSDLERHVQTKHSSDRTYLCPVDTCDRSVDGFKRKDKLDDHIKKVHARFQCTFDHCESKVLEIEKQVHLDQFHDGKPELAPSPSRMMGRSGIFECNLFGCESTISKFKISSACKHLRRCHGVSYDTDFAYTNAAVGNGPKSIRGGAFVLQPSPRLGVKHKPCTHCISNATVDDNVKTGIDQAT